jgi:glycosyltransferase involved in cell wall biosynthesis
MSFAVADHFLTVSTHQLRTFVQSGMSPDSITLVRNGVDLDVFKVLPQPREPEFTFCYAGGFQRWQNLDIMVRAFEIYPHREHRMLLIGFREWDKPFKKMLDATFGSRVKLVDFTDQQTLVKMLHSVKIVLTGGGPTRARRHCFPTKFAEYAALGRPVLVNDVDESADFVRQYHCGFVAEPTPEGMARSMEEAAAASYETLVEMGIRARNMAEEIFSWDKIGDTYADMVRRLTASTR